MMLFLHFILIIIIISGLVNRLDKNSKQNEKATEITKHKIISKISEKSIKLLTNQFVCVILHIVLKSHKTALFGFMMFF